MRCPRVREEEIGIIGTEAITSKAVSSSGRQVIRRRRPRDVRPARLPRVVFASPNYWKCME